MSLAGLNRSVQTEPNAASVLTFLLAHKALIFSRLSLMIRFMGLVEHELIMPAFSLPFLRRLLSGVQGALREAEQPQPQNPLPLRLDAPENELNLPEIKPDLSQIEPDLLRMRLNPEQLFA